MFSKLVRCSSLLQSVYVTWAPLLIMATRRMKVPATGGQIYGGRGGIRTLGTVAGTPLFESGTFNHSDISPYP